MRSHVSPFTGKEHACEKEPGDLGKLRQPVERSAGPDTKRSIWHTQARFGARNLEGTKQLKV